MKPEKTNQKPALLSAQAVGVMLSLSKRAVFRMRSTGKICKPLKVGQGAIRWRRSDLERWIELGCPTMKDFEALKQNGGK